MRRVGVCRSTDRVPLAKNVVADELHHHDDVGLQMSRVLFAMPLYGAECLGLLLAHPDHLQAGDHEACCRRCADDGPDMVVGVGLHDAERPALRRLQDILSVTVRIFNHLHLPREYSHHSAHVQAAELHVRILSSLQEGPLVLRVVHFDAVVPRVKGEQISLDKIGLGVKPLAMEDVPVLGGGHLRRRGTPATPPGRSDPPALGSGSKAQRA
mmetsp:Transcript_48257/g.134736  ORF Transcript_48257/g.134736 Transcript_48257/m.134736 type:complete len:212 (+) Transcript_48257:645-1280(+)